ncbi:MAG: hypothetical protein COA38_00375 [Fluviicola sp.]|nr:MAG: hypothetical protein COA38_00375 [Fluviicola sp.]
MIAFLKRHRISIGLLVLTSIIGFVLFMKVSPLDIWLIEYEFDTRVESELPKFEKADTVFQFDDIMCRNYTSSIADTLIEEGIRRHELKVYLFQPSKEKVIELSDEILSSQNVRVLKHKFRETQKNKQVLLYWVLFGFFLGMVVEFIIALKKKPSTN